MSSGRRLVVEADGGSRGNPGPAAYGALVRDAATGQVVAERGEAIGVATNNVAEYRGLIAGLQAARDIDASAHVDVRLDSKLIVEQMSGRWKIKDATLRALAIEARDILPREQVDYEWVPREQNRDADALVNRALDASLGISNPSVAKSGATISDRSTPQSPRRAVPGWAADLGDPTVTLLARHGATEHSLAKLFSGSGGDDPPLAPVGRAQADALARELSARGRVDRIVSSPLLRARQTAEIVAGELGIADVGVVDGFAECDFGEWDGCTFGQVKERWPTELDAWLQSTSIAPPGGESFDQHRQRIERARDALLLTHPRERVVVVAHVTPIKMMVELALAAPVDALYRMELLPCSITTIAWWSDGNCSLQGFAESGHLRDLAHPGM